MGQTIIVSLIFFLSISSGSVLYAALNKHRYEECVPFSIFSIIFILYLFGLFHALHFGVFVVLGLCALIYVLSFVLVIVKKSFSQFIHRLLTPGCGLFFLLLLFLIYCNEGMLAYHTDDFSHWTDILRVMLNQDGFGVTASARSYFGTYPPAISLIEYFYVSIGSQLFPTQPFSEHFIYLAYQITAMSLFLPFLNRLKGKNILYVLLFSLGCFIVPIILFDYFFYSLYMDPMVSLLAGFCLIYPHLQSPSRMHYVTFLLALFTLVLTKNIGIFFALMAGISYLVTQPVTQNGLSSGRKVSIAAFLKPAMVFATIILSYMSWKVLLLCNQPLFSNPWAGGQTFAQTIQSFVGGGGITAAQKETVMGTFVDRLFVIQFYLGGHQQIGVCFLFLFVFLLILLAFLTSYIPSISRKQRTALVVVSAVTTLLYMAGLCFAYLYHFSMDESEFLFSFSRYAAIPLTMLLMLIFGALCKWLEYKSLSKNSVLILLALFVVLFPYDGFRCLFKHEKVIESHAYRAPYDQLAADVLNSIPDQDANIYFISQEPESLDDFWVMRSLLRPLVIDNHNYYIAPSGALDAAGAKDITRFSKELLMPTKMDAQQWKNILASRYDYVLLFHLNNAFYNDYASVFTAPATIHEHSLYKVQPDGSLLYVLLKQ